MRFLISSQTGLGLQVPTGEPAVTAGIREGFAMRLRLPCVNRVGLRIVAYGGVEKNEKVWAQSAA
jgi:hypothetical protein